MVPSTTRRYPDDQVLKVYHIIIGDGIPFYDAFGGFYFWGGSSLGGGFKKRAAAFFVDIDAIY
jgi:hypothetical protein